MIKDPRTVDFTLRKGVKFHNGQELTSADVVYSIQMQMNPPAPGSTGTLSFFPAIVGVEPVSKYVVRVKLSKPDASLFGWFAWNRWSAIGPNNLYQQINPVTQGIGTGRSSSSSTSRTTTSPTSGSISTGSGPPVPGRHPAQDHPGRADGDCRAQAGAIDGATISAATPRG